MASGRASKRRLFLPLCLSFAALLAWAAEKPLIWKPAKNAFLHVNGQPLKDWDAFQTEKKANLYLIEMEGTFILVDAQRKQAFELPQSTIHRQASDLLWDPDTLPQTPVATSAWSVRDVGFAQRIRFHLDQLGRDIDLQIPHKWSRL